MVFLTCLLHVPVNTRGQGKGCSLDTGLGAWGQADGAPLEHPVTSPGPPGVVSLVIRTVNN